MVRGVEFVNNTGQHCKVQQDDGLHALVCSELLHFIENPDIASIPQTSEDYYRECLSVDPTQISDVLNPKPLSPLQEELIQHHTYLHHLPFPKLILLAEKGRDTTTFSVSERKDSSVYSLPLWPSSQAPTAIEIQEDAFHLQEISQLTLS